MYDPNLDTVVSADASTYGLGNVLRQKRPNGNLRPVSHISRLLNPMECRYAQIERGPHHNLGMRTISRILTRKTFQIRNRSQASRSPTII